MKKIEHQIFLKRNGLATKLLLQPIQEKIEIFDRMHALLDKVSVCDKGALIDELEALDLEILEDIDEEYADQLEHNEITEELKEKQVAFEKVIEDAPVPKPEPVQVPKSKKKPTDEDIINELVKMGRTENIGRSTFRDLGVKVALGWETIIGKYRVTRTSVFRYRYEIERV